MNRKLSYLGLIFLGILLLSLPYFSTAQEKASEKQVDVIKVNDIISPAIAEFITRSIEEAARNKAQCLVIQMDTPGGLDLSMRDIIKDMMSSDIPIVVYVSPSGARAASAGALITVAADIAAMAPGLQGDADGFDVIHGLNRTSGVGTQASGPGLTPTWDFRGRERWRRGISLP